MQRKRTPKGLSAGIRVASFRAEAQAWMPARQMCYNALRWGGETTLLTELALGPIREGRFLGSPFSH